MFSFKINSKTTAIYLINGLITITFLHFGATIAFDYFINIFPYEFKMSVFTYKISLDILTELFLNF
jgi:hypothetical protein